MTMISVPNSTQAFQIQVNFAHLFSGCPDPWTFNPWIICSKNLFS
jgi:hypothetical protein